MWGASQWESSSTEKDLGVLSFPTEHSTLIINKNGPLMYRRRILATKLREPVLPYSVLARHIWNSGPNFCTPPGKKGMNLQNAIQWGAVKLVKWPLYEESLSWHCSSCRRKGTRGFYHLYKYFIGGWKEHGDKALLGCAQWHEVTK